jgi:hypothetical protein
MPKASAPSYYHRYRNWVRNRRHDRQGRFLPPDPVHVPAEVQVFELLGQAKRPAPIARSSMASGWY